MGLNSSECNSASDGSGRRTGIQGEAPYGTSSDNMPADYGTGLNDINPEDIESVTVLKGAGAAALYGQRGANGAIIITTKSGNSKRKGFGVTLNSNANIEQVNRWPDLQYEYGQGLDGAAYYSYGAGPDGASTSGTSSAYGPRFNGQMFYQYDPARQNEQSPAPGMAAVNTHNPEEVHSGNVPVDTQADDDSRDKVNNTDNDRQ